MNKAEIALTKMLMSTDPATVADACAVKCLKLIATREVPAAATDGVVLLVNPDFLEPLTIDQICGLLVHEVCHVRFGHNARFCDSGWLDHDRANRSMDREINPLVQRAGYQLPPNGCFPSGIGCNDGLSWEEYYQHEASQPQQDEPQQDGEQDQPQEQPESSEASDQQQDGSQDGNDGESSPDGQPEAQDGNQADSGPVADGVHAPGSLTNRFAPQLLDEDQTAEELAEEVAEALTDTAEQGKVEQTATKPHKAGSESSSQQLGADLIHVTDCRWQDTVIDLIATRASGESIADWSRPSRRSIAQGSYRPARRKVCGYRLALILDVSGSCVGYFDYWQSMARELVEAVPEITEIDIYYHDTGITGTDRWSRRSGEEVTIKSQGGGGTDFRQVLYAVEQTDIDGAILFTDSEGYWPDCCSIDCVTVQPPGSYRQSPFGKTIRINEWQ